jgi:hypothetical protein
VQYRQLIVFLNASAKFAVKRMRYEKNKEKVFTEIVKNLLNNFFVKSGFGIDSSIVQLFAFRTK